MIAPEREALLRAYAAEGLSQKVAAKRLGLSNSYVSIAARELGIKFVHGRIKRSDTRADEMAVLYRDGHTLEEIGQRYGLTRERVRQLLTKYHGISRRDGGNKVRSVRRLVEHDAKRDQRYLAKYGCTFAQWQGLIREPRNPTRAYIEQRRNAHTRNIGWELTLWQWWTAWQESGHWHERGRGQHGYMMSRKRAGPYAPDNLLFVPTGRRDIGE
jgi:transposase